MRLSGEDGPPRPAPVRVGAGDDAPVPLHPRTPPPGGAGPELADVLSEVQHVPAGRHLPHPLLPLYLQADTAQ